jgi:hypothetical protein
MTSFAKIWSIRADRELTPGATVSVSLKRGGTKETVVGAYLYTKGEYHYYASPVKTTED